MKALTIIQTSEMGRIFTELSVYSVAYLGSDGYLSRVENRNALFNTFSFVEKKNYLSLMAG